MEMTFARSSLSAALALVGGVVVVALVATAAPARQAGEPLHRVGQMNVGVPIVAPTRIDAQPGAIRFFVKGTEVAMLDEFGLHTRVQPSQ